VRAVTNPGIQVLGFLATKFDKRTINSREVLEYLNSVAAREGIQVFNPVINHSVRITEAPNYGKPIVQLHPELDGAIAYEQVAEAILHG
jgi:chromosome partitioning protein